MLRVGADSLAHGGAAVRSRIRDVDKASELIDPIMDKAYDYPHVRIYSDGTIQLDGTFDAEQLRAIAAALDVSGDHAGDVDARGDA